MSPCVSSIRDLAPLVPRFIVSPRGAPRRAARLRRMRIIHQPSYAHFRLPISYSPGCLPASHAVVNTRRVPFLDRYALRVVAVPPVYVCSACPTPLNGATITSASSGTAQTHPRRTQSPMDALSAPEARRQGGDDCGAHPEVLTLGLRRRSRPSSGLASVVGPVVVNGGLETRGLRAAEEVVVGALAIRGVLAIRRVLPPA